ncbi:MAG: hypothetical protein V1487_02725 [bacterium]
MMGENEFAMHICYDWSGVNGLGQVVVRDENKGGVQKSIKQINDTIRQKLQEERREIASWTPDMPMFGGNAHEHQLAVSRFTARLNEREKRTTLVMGDYINVGQEYPMQGMFDHVPITMVHGMFHHMSEGGGIFYTEDGWLSDGAHRAK